MRITGKKASFDGESKLFCETLIVVWEGTDGSGKTTLMRSVEGLLSARGYHVETYKTPGETQTGRFALEYGNMQGIDGLTRMLLFAANTADDSKFIRMQIERLRPHFEFIDRYYLCSIVYGIAVLKTRHSKAVNVEDAENVLGVFEKLGEDVFVKPDLYVIVDVEENVRLRRAKSKSSKTSSADFSYELDSSLQEEVRKLYRLLVERRSIRAIWVDNVENKLKENAVSVADKLMELRQSML
ncbi:MAG: hypothetical protein QXO01_00555 [Nitrososphaerota archaeon]